MSVLRTVPGEALRVGDRVANVGEVSLVYGRAGLVQAVTGEEAPAGGPLAIVLYDGHAEPLVTRVRYLVALCGQPLGPGQPVCGRYRRHAGFHRLAPRTGEVPP